MSDSHSPKAQIYWKENIRLVLTLLAVWFLVSYVMAILFVDIFDNIRFFGFKFGFWMAQQGSIYCFVVIIFIYVYKMNKIDHKYQMSENHEETTTDKRYNSRHRDERGSRHPVRGGCHTICKRRNASTCNVKIIRSPGPCPDSNTNIYNKGYANKNKSESLNIHTYLSDSGFW